MTRILVTDDEADLRQLITYTLTEEGFEVSVAKDGNQALAAIQEHMPDLIVLDVMMPGLSGLEVLEAMNEAGLRPETKVIMLTARASERDWEQGYKLGADLYMTKPFDPEDLLQAVKETLACSKQELQAKREKEADKAHLLSQLESLFDE